MAGYYDIGLQKIIDVDGAGATARINVAADTLKVRPIRTGTYTYAATHASMTPVTAATGSPGDVTLGGQTVKTGTDGGCFDANNATFAAWTAGTAMTGLVIYRFVTDDAGSYPIVYLDGFTVTPNGGDITFQWANASPFIFKI